MAEDMNDKISDIREWLVRIDTKVDYLNEVKSKAESADKKANEAWNLAEQNREDIRDMKANSKWLWGTLLTIFGIMVTIGIAVFK
mgnify:CR=1 FL=1